MMMNNRGKISFRDQTYEQHLNSSTFSEQQYLRLKVMACLISNGWLSLVGGGAYIV